MPSDKLLSHARNSFLFFNFKLRKIIVYLSRFLLHWMQRYWKYYSDTIMRVMASQIISLTIVYSTVCSGADQRKHQSSVSLAFVRGIHLLQVNSLHKGPVIQKIFPFDDVIMNGMIQKMANTQYININSECPSDAIWQHISSSALFSIPLTNVKLPLIDSVAFTWVQFCRNCSWYQSVRWMWKLYFQNYCWISQGMMYYG